MTQYWITVLHKVFWLLVIKTSEKEIYYYYFPSTDARAQITGWNSAIFLLLPLSTFPKNDLDYHQHLDDKSLASVLIWVISFFYV